jgi:hypothetical protein
VREGWEAARLDLYGNVREPSTGILARQPRFSVRVKGRTYTAPVLYSTIATNDPEAFYPTLETHLGVMDELDDKDKKDYWEQLQCLARLEETRVQRSNATRVGSTIPCAVCILPSVNDVRRAMKAKVRTTFAQWERRGRAAQMRTDIRKWRKEKRSAWTTAQPGARKILRSLRNNTK